MNRVIDASTNLTDFAQAIAAAGVKTVIRYYNRTNSNALPSKRIEPSEAAALADAGLTLAVVFQQRGGAGGHFEDLDAESGARDAARAIELAGGLRQPEGSAIYFAVDHDFFRVSELARIEPYFAAVRRALGDRFRVGCYGSGKVGGHMVAKGHADLIWLAAAKGWSGTRQMLETDAWALFQKDLDLTFPGGGFRYDGNVVNPAFADFGQFSPGAERLPTPERVPVTTLMEVTARSGLRVRRGPGTMFDEVTALPAGTIVTVLAMDGGWAKVDLEGDGLADGFMFAGFLRLVSGGVPVAPTDIPVLAPALAPALAPVVAPIPVERNPAYKIARAELDLDVREVPGAGSNPRIVMYHGSTSGGAMDDDVPWCSSFTNYCVEQAGMTGTDSKWAMSWHDSGWGRDVTDDPEEGDICVFRRRSGGPAGSVKGGHVGFFTADLGERIALLGGNQSNRVKITRYPKDGMLGSNHYELLSIRRP